MPTITTFKDHVPDLTEYQDRPRTKPKLYERIPQERFVASHSISFPNEDNTRTTMIAMESSKWSNLPVPTGSFEEKLDILAEYFAEDDVAPSLTKKRSVRERAKYADGRRHFVPPVIMIYYRLEDDVMNEIGNDPRFRRLLLSGRDKPTFIPFGNKEVEVAHWNPNGSAPSYEFYVRWDGYYEPSLGRGGKPKWHGKIMRIIGRDIWAYLKEKLLDCAEAFLKDIPVMELPQTWLTRYYSSFEPDELELIKQYLAANTHAIRLLYEKLTRILVEIRPEVITRNGILPKSMATASMRIAHSLSDEEEWYLPPKWAMQMGALASAGPRIFNVRRGYHEDLNIYDISSMYPYLFTVTPLPTDTNCKRIGEQPFILDDWKGKHGLICISGCAPKLPKAYRAIREHNPVTKRLDYIQGPFEMKWVTIAQAVISVMDNRLTVNQIHDGCLVVGDPNDSYLARYARMMYQYKDKFPEGSMQYNLIKGLMVAPSGKAQETNKNHQYVDKAETIIPVQAMSHYYDMEEAYINGDDDFEAFIDEEWQDTRDPSKFTTFGKAVQRKADYAQQAGVYYNPVLGAQITGDGAAILGLFAYHTHAVHMHTDSIFTNGPQTQGFRESMQIMREAGYPMPETGMGSFKLKAENAYGYLAAGGLYYIEYIDVETGEVKHKQATHGIIQIGERDVKELIIEFLRTGQIEYQTDPSKLRYKQALLSKEKPGTVKSRKMTLVQPSSNDLNQLTTLSPFQDRILQDANKYLANSALNKIAPVR